MGSMIRREPEIGARLRRRDWRRRRDDWFERRHQFGQVFRDDLPHDVTKTRSPERPTPSCLSAHGRFCSAAGPRTTCGEATPSVTRTAFEATSDPSEIRLPGRPDRRRGTDSFSKSFCRRAWISFRTPGEQPTLCSRRCRSPMSPRMSLAPYRRSTWTTWMRGRARAGTSNPRRRPGT